MHWPVVIFLKKVGQWATPLSPTRPNIPTRPTRPTMVGPSDKVKTKELLSLPTTTLPLLEEKWQTWADNQVDLFPTVHCHYCWLIAGWALRSSFCSICSWYHTALGKNCLTKKERIWEKKVRPKIGSSKLSPRLQNWKYPKYQDGQHSIAMGRWGGVLESLSDSSAAAVLCFPVIINIIAVLRVVSVVSNIRHLTNDSSMMTKIM